MTHLDMVEQVLDEVLPKCEERPAAFHEAMRYAIGGKGKRIRPLICLAAAEAVGGRAEDARYPAAAIELLHNYTLIHDDLPAMDNDVERRGMPTVWVKYGQANAILAGDALQAIAFGAAAKAPRNAGRIVSELAVAAKGVVDGQVEDIAATGDVSFIYRHKTADLFMAAAVMGALAAGADDAEAEAMRDFALNLGLAFQYEDDLIDGDSPFSREETVRLVEETTQNANRALEGLKGDTSRLRQIATGLVGRTV